jgi:hypothetical protein
MSFGLTHPFLLPSIFEHRVAFLPRSLLSQPGLRLFPGWLRRNDSRVFTVLEHCPDITISYELLKATAVVHWHLRPRTILSQLSQNNTYGYKETPYSKHFHSHHMLSMSNMVADEKAEKQTGNNRDAMFKKSRWSDQKRPN